MKIYNSDGKKIKSHNFYKRIRAIRSSILYIAGTDNRIMLSSYDRELLKEIEEKCNRFLDY